MKQIAIACGFRSYPHFIIVFKEHFGYPPGEWRKITKENLESASVILTKEESDAITEKLDGMDFEIFGGHK